jgi:hypothetical protein
MADEPKKVRRIKYALERDGVKSDARQDIDNPFSPNFLTLDARNDGDKARWWALYGKRKGRPDAAVLEQP